MRVKNPGRVLPSFLMITTHFTHADERQDHHHIEALPSDLKGEKEPAVAVDGWNIGVTPVSSSELRWTLIPSPSGITGGDRMPIVNSTHFYFETQADHFKNNVRSADGCLMPMEYFCQTVTGGEDPNNDH